MTNKKHGGKRVGAGRKTTIKPNKKPKTLNLDLQAHEGLEELKKMTGKSQAVIVETLIEKAVKTPKILD